MGDAELLAWTGAGYPDALDPLRARFRPPWARAVFVGQGWWPLLVDVDAELAALDPDYRLRVIREELSELVIEAETTLIGQPADSFGRAVMEAERRAGRICEVCGRRGRFLRQGRFFVVLCWDHQQQRGAVRPRAGDEPDDMGARLTDAEVSAAIGDDAPPRTYLRAGHADTVELAQRLHSAIEQQMAGWPSTAGLACALGLTRSAVLNRVHGGKLLAVRRDNGRFAFPPWQLSADQTLLHGLADVLGQFPADYDAMAIHITLMRPREEFGGLSALACWLCEGDVARLMEWVRHLG